jgi:hypothetical protein
MAKKKTVGAIDKSIVVDCLLCDNGALSAYDLINCAKLVVPQVNRKLSNSGCCFYSKKI